jgi:DNA-directed RNA polymerase specialized sigma subunit
MAHTKKVIMPNSPAAAKQEELALPSNDFQPSFGFESHFQQGRPDKKQSLESAYSQWQNAQTQQNLRRVIDAASPVISTAMTSYAGGDRALRGRAKALAAKAVKSYDPERGTKLGTHLMIQLQPLRRSFTQRMLPVSMPERVQLELSRLNQAEDVFKQTHEREPSDEELSDELGLSKRRIAHLRKFSRGAVSESQLRDPESGEAYQPGTAQVTPEDVWLEFVYHDLDPIDKKIMEWKTGLYGKSRLGTSEVARRLNITPSAVSQRAAKIANKLEELKHGASNR